MHDLKDIVANNRRLAAADKGGQLYDALLKVQKLLDAGDAAKARIAVHNAIDAVNPEPLKAYHSPTAQAIIDRVWADPAQAEAVETRDAKLAALQAAKAKGTPYAHLVA